MALDDLGSDDIEVDGVMSRPSDPMLCKRKCARVFAPIAFSTRKTFWKKFLGNGVPSVPSVLSIEFTRKISVHFGTFGTLDSEQIRSRDLFLLKNKNPQKNL